MRLIRPTRPIAAVAAVALAAGLALTFSSPVSATPPPPNPFQGSAEVAGSAGALSAGSAVTAPQYFEIAAVENFSPFIWYPYGGPSTWQHVRRIDSLEAGAAHTAKYVVVGTTLPDDFWLGYDGVNGHVGTDRRPYEAPNISPGAETLTMLPGLVVVAGPQVAVPGVPGTVAAAITLPTRVPDLSSGSGSGPGS